MRDANQIASYTLWRAIRHHGAVEKTRREEMAQMWREARAAARKRPEPRVKLGPRVQAPKLTPDQLARVGRLDGLLDP